MTGDRSARRGAWLGLLGVILMGGMAGEAWSQAELPDGEGKEVVETACTACHGLAHFTGSRFSREDWEYVVNDMIGWGALITDQEVTVIVDYLTEHFGPEEQEERSEGEAATGN